MGVSGMGDPIGSFDLKGDLKKKHGSHSATEELSESLRVRLLCFPPMLVVVFYSRERLNDVLVVFQKIDRLGGSSLWDRKRTLETLHFPTSLGVGRSIN